MFPVLYGRRYDWRRLPRAYQRFRYEVDEPWLGVECVRVEDGIGQELRLVQRLESCTLSAPIILIHVRPHVHTFVAIDECIFDNHRAAIRRSVLLRLAPRLPEAARVLDLVVWADAARHPQHMAG
jgi:hypothetical protein